MRRSGGGGGGGDGSGGGGDDGGGGGDWIASDRIFTVEGSGAQVSVNSGVGVRVVVLVGGNISRDCACTVVIVSSIPSKRGVEGWYHWYKIELVHWHACVCWVMVVRACACLVCVCVSVCVSVCVRANVSLTITAGSPVPTSTIDTTASVHQGDVVRYRLGGISE